MNLFELLDVNLIEMDMPVKTKEEAIRFLSHKLFENGCVSDERGFVEAVFDREAVGETGMGNHIAIPHGLTPFAKKASVAIGRVNGELEWESLDDQPVRLVFLLAAPTDELQKTHLQMLAQLASVLAYKANVDRLLNVTDAKEFFTTFEEMFKKQIEKRNG